VASSLGSLRKNGQFIIRKNKFESFLDTCELVYRQPKGFVMDDHSIQQLIATHGFADLGEDASESNHQDEAKDPRLCTEGGIQQQGRS
jgi:hypothetical protein